MGWSSESAMSGASAGSAAGPWGAVIGGIAGGFLGSDAEELPSTATAEFMPVNLATPMGGTRWDELEGGGYNLASSGDPLGLSLSGHLGNIGLEGISGLQGPTAGARSAGYAAGGDIYSNYMGSQNLSGQMPAFTQNQGLYSGVNQGYAGAVNNFMPGFNQRSRGLENIMSGSVGQLSNQFQGMEGNTLDLLRQGAARQNNYGASSKISELMNSGRLGTAGGRQAMESMMGAQNQQDLAFQLAAKQFSLGQQGQYNQTLDRRYGHGINALNAYSNAGQVQGGLLRDAGQRETDLYNRGFQLNELANTRGQQRLQNSMGLFGFANDIDTGLFKRALGSVEGMEMYNQGLRDLMRVGIGASDVATQQPISLKGGATPGSSGMIGEGIGAIAGIFK